MGADGAGRASEGGAGQARGRGREAEAQAGVLEAEGAEGRGECEGGTGQQLLQRRQLEWQQRAEQRLRDLLARRWGEEQKRKRWRVARTRGAARRRWRQTQRRTAAAVARGGDCLRSDLDLAGRRSFCCSTGCVRRRSRRLGGGMTCASAPSLARYVSHCSAVDSSGVKCSPFSEAA